VAPTGPRPFNLFNAIFSGNQLGHARWLVGWLAHREDKRALLDWEVVLMSSRCFLCWRSEEVSSSAAHVDSTSRRGYTG
jgi:hypothetical protein